MKTIDKLTITIKPFAIGTHEEIARKVCEEAVEAYGEHVKNNNFGNLLEECCDVIQASVNLMCSYGATESEIYNAMLMVTRKNQKRGRYK